MNHHVITCTGRRYDISLSPEPVRIHFETHSNFAWAVLDQINSGRIYDCLFAGRSGLTFLDIGANIGLVSIYASDACKRIVAVEPNPSHIQVLGCITQSLRDKIQIVQAALSPRNSDVQLYLCPDNTTEHSFMQRPGDQITVPGKTLTALLNEANLNEVDVCKIDIEGSEFLALNLPELHANRDRIRCYFMEVHTLTRGEPEDQVRKNRMIFEALFAAAGYQVENKNNRDTIIARR